MEFLLNNNKKLDNVWKYSVFKLNFEKVYCLQSPWIGTLKQGALTPLVQYSLFPFLYYPSSICVHICSSSLSHLYAETRQKTKQSCTKFIFLHVMKSLKCNLGYFMQNPFEEDFRITFNFESFHQWMLLQSSVLNP